MSSAQHLLQPPPSPPAHPLRQALQAASPARADHLMRAACLALIPLQRGTTAVGLQALGAAPLQAELDSFPVWCIGHEFGVQWDADAQARWQRVGQALLQSVLAQPAVPLHMHWTVDHLPASVAEFALASADLVRANIAAPSGIGPVTYDLLGLLRDVSVLADPPFAWDDAQELDWSVRYWQAARAAAVPVPADFGEFWRDFEWLCVWRHLAQMGALCRMKHEADMPIDSRHLPALLSATSRVALRYGALKPLLRLLEPLSGAAVKAGYTF